MQFKAIVSHRVGSKPAQATGDPALNKYIGSYLLQLAQAFPPLLHLPLDSTSALYFIIWIIIRLKWVLIGNWANKESFVFNVKSEHIIRKERN